MEAEKKYYKDVKEELMKETGMNPALALDEVSTICQVACNIEECFYEYNGGCTAERVMITQEGCMTDRNLVED